MGRAHARRIDIQILRGAAILSVFAFHLWPRLVPAGFLGVDLFFVVSGFLMAWLYDMSRLTPSAFYLKRATRILPAYYATVLLAVCAGAAILLPHELGEVIKSAFWAIGLAGNIDAWSINSYFDASYFRPLLHLWSLGVEVQFYLLFPLMAWFWRKAPWAVILGLVGSLLACLVLLPISPKTPFFMTPFRLWEFGIGFLAAQWVGSRKQLVASNGLTPWLGCAGLLLVAVLAFVPIPEVSHPGLAALAVCCATAAVLVFGLPGLVMRSAVGRGLAWLGDYSYSLYLVHFPIIAFTLYRPFEGGRLAQPSALQAAAIIAGSLGAAALLHHGLENRFRGAKPRRFWSAQLAGALVVLLCVAAMPAIQSPRFSRAQHRISAAWADRGVYRCGKLARILHPTALSCELTHGGGATYLYVGDSHADAAKEALAAVGRRHGVSIRMMTQNCAVGSPPCDVETVMDEARRRKVRGLILHSRVGATTDEALAAVARKSAAAGLSVALIEPVPEWRTDVPKALYEGVRPVENDQDHPRLPHDRGFRWIAVRPAFCNPSRAVTDRDGAPLYFDNTHLTMTGGRRLGPAFEAALSQE